MLKEKEFPEEKGAAAAVKTSNHAMKIAKAKTIDGVTYSLGKMTLDANCRQSSSQKDLSTCVRLQSSAADFQSSPIHGACYDVMATDSENIPVPLRMFFNRNRSYKVLFGAKSSPMQFSIAPATLNRTPDFRAPSVGAAEGSGEPCRPSTSVARLEDSSGRKRKVNDGEWSTKQFKKTVDSVITLMGEMRPDSSCWSPSLEDLDASASPAADFKGNQVHAVSI